MLVIRSDPSQATPVQGALFRGDVTRTPLVGDEQSKQVTVGVVSFAPGGRNVFHVHSFDQVLYITEGEGIVATEAGEQRVQAGDLAFIPAGEKHWHGAAARAAMTHLTVGAPGTTQVVE